MWDEQILYASPGIPFSANKSNPSHRSLTSRIARSAVKLPTTNLLSPFLFNSTALLAKSELMSPIFLGPVQLNSLTLIVFNP